ncbi:MAG: PQQ-binding-like beta-propeller repeat protein [Desulfobacterales bacterium]
MKKITHQNFAGQNFLMERYQRHSGSAGNVLIYVVVLMLIFGTLGVAMVSLFSSSMASTATSNDTRRARYLSEAGVRYAIGEMRKEDFDEDYIIDPLNTLTYTVDDAGTFKPNIFGPWFDSDADVDAPDVVNASPRLGEIPVDFATDPANPLNNVWLVNYEYITGTGPDIVSMRDPAYGYAKSGTSLAIDIAGSSFLAETGERLVLGVAPTATQTITEGQNLTVARDARFFFPPFNGAINIDRVDYAYARLVDDPDNDQVILENVTAYQFTNTLPTFPVPTVSKGSGSGTYDGDFVILSPRNYMVMAEGTSDEVSAGNAWALGINVYDREIRPESRKADITAEDLVTSLSQQESDTRFFEPNLTDFELEIGGGGINQFGSAFYSATRDIGGERDFCEEGACLFGLGIRTYFLMDFTSQGDGIAFTLINGANNRKTSAGGDGDLSELMGYAGDSRIDGDNPFTGFLATDPQDRGLDPPKIAVEFDTRTNNDTLAYCNGPNANQNTRDDPLLNNQDAVQYVFWASEDLDLSCRTFTDNSTYDDNRHGPGLWQFDEPAGSVISSPAVASDGTIYVGSNDNKVYAINPNGTLKWDFLTGGDVRSSPAIASDGTIYVGSDDGILYAFNPGGPPAKWTRPNPVNAGAAFSLGRPAIGTDGTIYVSDQVSALFAVRPTDGGVLWTYDLVDDNRYMPSVDSARGNVYTDVAGNAIAAVNASTGIEKWRVGVGSDIDSTPVVGPDGTIYLGTDTANSLFAVNPDTRMVKWQFPTPDFGDVNIIPALSPDASVVYAVSDGVNNSDGFVYAVDTATGAENWSFTIVSDIGQPPGNVTSSPAVDPTTGTIYVGSDDNKVIALNPDGTLKWEFITNGKVKSSPAVGSDGTIYVGSNGNSVYALMPFDEEPRNLQGLLLDSAADVGGIADSAINWLNGAGTKGPWAVRLEVDRITLPGGEGDYELRLWMKQCDNATCDNLNINDPFFKDTRIIYNQAPNLVQFFQLDALDNAKFDRFLFGFTAAAGAQAQSVSIANFSQSFVRIGDPIITP